MKALFSAIVTLAAVSAFANAPAATTTTHSTTTTAPAAAPAAPAPSAATKATTTTTTTTKAGMTKADAEKACTAKKADKKAFETCVTEHTTKMQFDLSKEQSKLDGKPV